MKIYPWADALQITSLRHPQFLHTQMDLSQYVEKIRKDVARETRLKGFTIKNIEASLESFGRFMDEDKMKEYAAIDLADLTKSLKHSCAAGSEVASGREIRSLMRDFICSVDPRWLPVFLIVADNIEDSEGKRIVILESYIVNELSPRITTKIEHDYRALYIGFLINEVIDGEGAPGFVYTFGHKNCPSDATERVGIVCAPPKEKYAGSPYQLLTEYMEGTVTFHEWLQEKRDIEDIKFVFLQVVGNLLLANHRYSFVHGNLSTRKVLVSEDMSIKTITVPMPGRKLVPCEGRVQAHIIDYSLSTYQYADHPGKDISGLSTLGTTKWFNIPYTAKPTNSRDPRTDILKLLLTAFHSGAQSNKKSVSKIAKDYFGVDNLGGYANLLAPDMVVPPNENIYNKLPTLNKSHTLLSEGSNLKMGRAKKVGPVAQQKGNLSALSKIAVGEGKGMAVEATVLTQVDSFLEEIVSFMNVLDTDPKELERSDYIKALHSLLATTEFLWGQVIGLSSAVPEKAYRISRKNKTKEGGARVRERYDRSYEEWL